MSSLLICFIVDYIRVNLSGFANNSAYRYKKWKTVNLVVAFFKISHDVFVIYGRKIVAISTLHSSSESIGETKTETVFEK